MDFCRSSDLQQTPTNYSTLTFKDTISIVYMRKNIKTERGTEISLCHHQVELPKPWGSRGGEC